MAQNDSNSSAKVLIVTHLAKDAVHIAKVLAAADLNGLVCPSLNAAAEKVLEAGMILVTEEVLMLPEAHILARALQAQPSWSAIPILVFYGGESGRNREQKRAEHPFQNFADLDFLPRPMHAVTLISAVRASLKDRKRQFEIKKLLEEQSTANAQIAKFARGLAEEKTKLDALISESASSIALMRGPDLVFEIVNKKWIEAMSPREYLGRRYVDVYPELVNSLSHQSLLDTFFTGVPYAAHELKLKVKTAAGFVEDQYYNYSNVRIMDAYGQPYGVYCHASNVTESVLARKKIEETAELLRVAQQAAEFSAKNLREFFNQVPSPMVILEGPEHRFVLANAPYERLMGRQVMGKTVAEAFSPEEVSRFVPLLDRVYETGEPFTGRELPFRIPEATGAIQNFFLDFVYHPFRGDNGEIKGILVVVHDVTETVIARENINNQNHWLEEVLNRLPIGLIMAAPGSAKYQFANRAAYKMLGQSPIGNRPDLSQDKLVIRDLQERILSIDEIPSARASRGEELVNEIIIVDKRKERLYVSCNSSTIPAMYGHEKTVLVPFLNVSDMKATEARLTVERNQLETIFQHSPAAMALWAGPNFIFEKVNPHYQAIFPDRILIGKPFLEACPEFKDQPFFDLLTKVLETGEPFIGQDVLARHTDYLGGPLVDHYYDFTYMRVTDSEGRPYGVYDHAMDVTQRVLDRKKLELAKAEAERANSLKSAFLANMSHEIRTPLGAMIGFADLLRDPNLTSSQHSNYIDILCRNGESLSVIINDILDLSKVEAGHLQMEYTDTYPLQLVEDVISLMRVKTKEKGLALDFKHEASTPQKITSDPIRLRQILLNIVGNAVKFTQFGSIAIRTSGCHINASKALCIEIADTGIGIDPSQIDKVFEMFVQADGSTTRRFGGTGLGLALSRQLARSLGGDVAIAKTELGKGTTFLVKVLDRPELRSAELQMSKADKKNRAQVSAKSLAGIKVLVVDDAADNRQLIWHYLNRQGAIIDTADNGVVGMQKALAGDYDIILMDIQMPEMDGYTATYKLRAAGFKKPIIALTAHAMNEVRNRVLSVGATAHLPKPIDPKELIAKISEYVH